MKRLRTETARTASAQRLRRCAEFRSWAAHSVRVAARARRRRAAAHLELQPLFCSQRRRRPWAQAAHGIRQQPRVRRQHVLQADVVQVHLNVLHGGRGGPREALAHSLGSASAARSRAHLPGGRVGPSTQERSAESPAEQRVSRRAANDARRQSSDSVEQSSARLESTSSAGRNAGAIAPAGAQERPLRVASGGCDSRARAIEGGRS